MEIDGLQKQSWGALSNISHAWHERHEPMSFEIQLHLLLLVLLVLLVLLLLLLLLLLLAVVVVVLLLLLLAVGVSASLADFDHGRITMVLFLWGCRHDGYVKFHVKDPTLPLKT